MKHSRLFLAVAPALFAGTGHATDDDITHVYTVCRKLLTPVE